MACIDRLRPLEALPMGEETYSFAILRPGGNDTALVNGIVNSAAKRKEINDTLLERIPPLEQVGFIDLNVGEPRMVMAGGEFCGNATRGAAWLALNGQPGELTLRVSGVASPLRAGINNEGEAYAQMPVYPGIDKISVLPDGFTVVEMEGITHLITYNRSLVEGKSDDDIKDITMQILRNKGLESRPAAGIMYTERTTEGLRILPVVYVSAVNTLYIETACGSGTTALGLLEAARLGISIDRLPVIQPSGLPIKISVAFDGATFTYAKISGPMSELGRGILTKDGTVIQSKKVSDAIDLTRAITQGGLLDLYKEAFSNNPLYEEYFTNEDMVGFFEEYRQKETGRLYLAYEGDRVVGFVGFLTVNVVPSISTVLDKQGIDTQNMWYAADIGVANAFRRQGLGQSLLTQVLSDIGANPVVMRTTLMNFPSQRLFGFQGFRTIPNVYQDVSGLRTDGQIRVDRRMFMLRPAL